MPHKFLARTLFSAALLSLAACSTTQPMMPANSSMGSTASSAMTGMVQGIDMVNSSEAGIGVGTISGVAVSGMMPRGGMSDQAYRITLRMDDGSQQVFATARNPELRVGDRIQIVNGIVMHS